MRTFSRSLVATMVVALGCGPRDIIPSTPPPAQAAGPAATADSRAKVRRIELTVTEKGFEPSPISVKKGEPLELAITRKTDQTCANDVIMPEYGVRKALPLNEPVIIAFTPARGGELRYGCGMDQMVSGILIVEDDASPGGGGSHGGHGAAGSQGHHGAAGHDGHAAPAPAADGNAAIAAAEKAAYERAKPVFEKYCSKCHASSGKKASAKKLKEFNMDTYPFGGHHAAEMGATIREVLGAAGEEATMPLDAPGSVKGAELDAILEWSRAFDKAHAAGLHQHAPNDKHGHGAH